MSVVFYFAGIHIDAVTRDDVGVSFFFELLNHCNLLGDMICRSADDLIFIDIEHVKVSFEAGDIFVGELSDGHRFSLRSLFHLVFALIFIRGEMADIGHIHDGFERISHNLLKRIPENIPTNVGAHISDMWISIHGWSTRIESDKIFFWSFVGRVLHQWNEFFLAATECVVEVKFHERTIEINRVIGL